MNNELRTFIFYGTFFALVTDFSDIYSINNSAAEDFTSLEETVRANTGDIENLKREIAELKEQLAQLRQGESETNTDSETATNKAPNDIIKEAESLIKNEKYADARKILKTFIEKNPKDIHVGMMYFYIGEAFFKEKNYRAAAKNFMESYKNNSKGSKTAEALYKLGDSFYKLSDSKKAKITFKKLIDDYSDSDFCAKAKEKLKELTKTKDKK